MNLAIKILQQLLTKKETLKKILNLKKFQNDEVKEVT